MQKQPLAIEGFGNIDAPWRHLRDQNAEFCAGAISQRLATEFFNAVREYLHWRLNPDEQGIRFDRYIQFSLVCGRVAPLTDALSDDVFDALYVLALDETHEHLKRELSAKPTYATAARCLLELIEANKENLMRRPELD